MANINLRQTFETIGQGKDRISICKLTYNDPATGEPRMEEIRDLNTVQTRMDELNASADAASQAVEPVKTSMTYRGQFQAHFTDTVKLGRFPAFSLVADQMDCLILNWDAVRADYLRRKADGQVVSTYTAMPPSVKKPQGGNAPQRA